jgi:hypothetical protein
MAYESGNIFGVGTQGLWGLAQEKKKKPTTTGTGLKGFVPTLVSPSTITPTKTEPTMTGPEIEKQGMIVSTPPHRYREEKKETEMPPMPFIPTTEIIEINDENLAEMQTKYPELGIDETWKGLPIEVGYKDENGNWVVVKAATTEAQQLHNLINLEQPQLTDITTSQPYIDLQNFANQMNNPEAVITDLNASVAWLENFIGMEPGEFSTTVSNMRDQLALNVYEQPGMPEEWKTAYDRETALEIQKNRNEAKQMMQALGAQGRTYEALMFGDQYYAQVADFNAQRIAARIDRDIAAQETNYNALKNLHDSLLNTGLESVGQYMTSLYQNRTIALQGYAQQITALAEMNKENIALYEAKAGVYYNTLMASLGVTTELLNQSSEFVNQYLAPYYVKLDRWALQQETEALEVEKKAAGWGAVGSGAITGMLIGGGPESPTGWIGAAIGAALGFLTGGGTIICTELYNQGLMDKEIYEADCEYGKYIFKTDSFCMNGYKKIAQPIVGLMKKSKLFTSLVKGFTKYWSYEMAYQMGYRKRGHIIGRLIMKIGVPICRFLGKEKSHGMG